MQEMTRMDEIHPPQPIGNGASGGHPVVAISDNNNNVADY